MITKAYEKKVLAWRAADEEGLRRENGWLALAGLFWLNEGENSIGSDPNSDIILPERAPRRLGSVHVDGREVTMRAEPGHKIRINEKLVAQSLLQSSQTRAPSFITLDHMRIVLHEHGGRYAFRVWDNERTERKSLAPLSWFPINERMRFKARYVRFKKPRRAEQPDTFGESVEARVDGRLTFRYEGKSYQLEVEESPKHTLFVRFRDGTSGRETYPASRYLYTPAVRDGKVVLDFNYSYSPPCAYTPFATCIFASPQNHLPFRIEAGEIYKEHA